eukprot:TRINITY_DN4422_c0_g1_i1.p1 TRINITY_DN4422_c0_g1~~TRINITY_DN4422_c0_g1_i1.p1  ORF type:complete len:1096 (-),score=173.28 TRINITY_DN4422_c0_g1_i1:22-3309(-)
MGIDPVAAKRRNDNSNRLSMNESPLSTSEGSIHMGKNAAIVEIVNTSSESGSSNEYPTAPKMGQETLSVDTTTATPHDLAQTFDTQQPQSNKTRSESPAPTPIPTQQLIPFLQHEELDPVPAEYQHLCMLPHGVFIPPKPSNDAERLRQLYRLRILDTSTTEPFFSTVAQVCARTFEAPIIGISLVDDERVWTKAIANAEAGESIRLEDTVCSWIISLQADEKCLVVPDLANDRRFKYGTFVRHGLLRFYAGAPLRLSTDESIIIGSLCVVDLKPRQFDEAQCELLMDIARLVMERIEMRPGLGTMQQKLSQSLAEVVRLNACLASTETEAVVMWDEMTLKLVYANRAFETMTGFTASAVRFEKGVNFLRGPESSQTTFDEIDRALHSLRLSRAYLGQRNMDTTSYAPTTVSADLCRKDGSVFAAILRLSRGQSDGSTTLLIGVIADSTRERQTEQAMDNARLQIQEATRSKDEFLANMSHEIRTPLNGIIAASTLLAENAGQYLTDSQNELVSTLQRTSQELLTLADTVLDFSKILDRGIKLLYNTVNLDDLLNRCIDLLMPRATMKGLDLSFDVDSDTPVSIWTDEGRLQQILLNLMGNAVKFTERGGVTVTVNARKVKRGKRKEESDTTTITTTTTTTTTQAKRRTTHSSSNRELRRKWEHAIMHNRKSTNIESISESQPQQRPQIQVQPPSLQLGLNASWSDSDSDFEVEATTANASGKAASPSKMAKETKSKKNNKAKETAKNAPPMSGADLKERHRPEMKRRRSSSLRVSRDLTQFHGSPVRHTKSIKAGKCPRYEITFRVTDTGIGMRDDSQRDLFTRLHANEQGGHYKAVGGAGLGLSLSQLLAQAMGGDIVLEKSVYGEGSTFRCSILASGIKPVVPIVMRSPQIMQHGLVAHLTAAAPHPAASMRRRSISPDIPKARRAALSPLYPAVSSSTSPSSLPQSPFSSGGIPELRILVVDDNKVNRTILGRMLKMLDYKNIDFAEDGSVVLKRIFEEGQQYHAIFMDLHMPVLDGLGCQKALLERLTPEAMPFVIAVTADVTQGIEMRCREAGMVGYLSKPLTKNHIDQMLQQVLAAVVSASLPSWFTA